MTENTDESKVVFERVKLLAGKNIAAKFSLPSLGQDHAIGLRTGAELYLFLTIADDGSAGGTLGLVTPIASVAKILPNGVVATYRHSYHQALVPEALFESSQVAIFEAAHGRAIDEAALAAMIRKPLEEPPARLGTPEFFPQHVALELVFHLSEHLENAGMSDDEVRGLLAPFLATDDLHVQISAVRALGAIGDRADELCDYLSQSKPGFAKVRVIWALKARKTKRARLRLEGYKSG